MKQFVRAIVPLETRRLLRWKVHQAIRKLKAPRMLVGYRDPSGTWRSRTRISDTVFFYHPERITIADNVFVWHYTILDGTGGLSIAEGAQIGAWVGLFTHSSHIAIRIYGDHYQEVAEAQKQGYPIASVSIGRYVFVGAGAKILPGVTLGDGALISAGAVVSKSVEPFQIVGGNPASVIGDTRKLDARYLRDEQVRRWYEEWQDNS
jgi:acetyltransferase-like isoleucine patch superfamily enzyme